MSPEPEARTFRPRPRGRVRRYVWFDGDVRMPGVALVVKRQLAAHFTIAEARALADKLHDFCDSLEAGQPVIHNPRRLDAKQ